MSSLPELAAGRFRYQLPLGEAATRRLVESLLAEPAERAATLATALATDRSLAVWAVLLCPTMPGAAGALASYAGWLAPRLAQLFTQPSITIDIPRCVFSDSAGAAPPSIGDGADGRFLALLAGAAEFLCECSTPRAERADVAELLPAWLNESFERTGGSDSSEVAPAEAGEVVTDWSAVVARLAAGTVRHDEQSARFAEAVEREKLAALKEFAYGAGHEINNPLANISARAQTLLKDERDPERRQKLAAINSQAFRAHEMIADLMLFAQPPDWKRVSVPIGPLLIELAPAWQRQADEQQTTLRLSNVDEPLAVWGDRSALAVALRALVANALEALGRGGTVEIALDTTTLNDASAARDAVAIRVRDDGPGIDPAVRARIFEPYYSGREAGRGLGFGLPKCWRIATTLGGRVDVASSATGGASFTLVLPLAPG